MAGRAWTETELAELRTGQWTAEQFALRHGRTSNGVRFQAARLDVTLPIGGGGAVPDFEVERPPSELPTASELRERRKIQFERKSVAKEARSLIPVQVNLHGPVGIAHMGDPHVDDDGTDIAKLERHVEVLANTEGMLAGNVGDYQNNWIGRIAHLYGQQSTSAAESWVLVEWLIRSLKWLYLVGGNHDAWSGAGDPLKWIAKHSGQLYEPNGARLGLAFPNGRVIRINARHNWPGSSQWNPGHGVGKAIQMGVRDHVVTCGHTHVSGYMPLKDPSSGLVSRGIQVASYKTYDRYAEEKGFRDQTIFCCPVTIIRPEFPDNDPRLVSFHEDPEDAAEYLTWLRSRTKAAA